MRRPGGSASNARVDPVRGAAPLARWLLALGGAGRDQELWLEQGARTARLTLRAGLLWRVEGVPLTPLGDLLRELQALDCARAHTLREGPGAVPIGVRLVVAGATTWAAVQRALALQHERAIAELLRLPVTRVRRRPGARAGGVGIDMAEAVWRALRTMVAGLPTAQRRELACPGRKLTLTPAGRRRAAGHADALAHDESVRAVLVALGFAAPLTQPDDGCALLLRKRRELCRNAGPQSLLDLSQCADAGHARGALRRLAGKLHPDRFQGDDPRLRQVSHEVMGALVRAASTFVA